MVGGFPDDIRKGTSQIQFHLVTARVNLVDVYFKKQILIISPSARCVSANAVCRSIDIFNKDCILLTDDVSQLST
jgi:hypothetical protein